MLNTSTQAAGLSLQQKHLWLQQRSGEIFHAQIALSLVGELDGGRLREALRRAVSRHEILRTVFRRLPGAKVPKPAVRPELEPAWQEIELDGAAEVEALLAETRRQPFDFAAGPLVRATLARLGPGRHALILDLPALCADGRSLANLGRELAAELAGRPPAGETLQYAQLTTWQSALLEDKEGDAEEGLAFWRRHPVRSAGLSDLPPARRGEGRGALASVSLHLGEGVADALRETASRCRASLEDVLLAAWAACVWRVTGEPEVTVGTDLPGRSFAAMEEALGLYARTVPLVAHFTRDLRFEEVVRELADQRQEAEQWLDYFAAAPAGAPEERGFPVGFRSERPLETIAAGGLSVSLLSQHCRTGLCGLQLQARDGGDTLDLALELDTQLYHRADVEAIAGRLTRLLSAVARGGQVALGRLDISSPAERHRLVIELNDTAAGIAGGASPAGALAEQAARRPGETALILGTGRWTFGELEDRVERLARRLRAMGVGPERRVAIVLERSPELVVAPLAVLRAGGAYVPLDPAAPPARLRSLLEDSGASVLLTREGILRRIEPVGLQVVDLDEPEAAGLAPADGRPFPQAEPDHLAYVIYTSGSTGRPKGVMVSRAGLEHYLGWARRAYAAAARVGSVLHSPVAFDLAVTSLFVPLLDGKPLALLSEESGLDALGAALGTGADFLKLTPAQIGLVPDEVASQVAALVLGGEELRGESVAAWRRRAPRLRLINEYGPTETVVGCCTYEIPEGEPAPGPVPIGRPISNARTYLLDHELQPVPAGAPGALYVGGAGMARGYLGAPELTADAFVPDPFGEIPGGRLYRTGDLARHLPDGALEFLGRIDHQVKVRGVRIEPGEIEAQLLEHPEVREAVVVARDDAAGRRHLVAYVVTRQVPVSEAELRSHLEAKLPAALIPSRYVGLEALPRTASGKIDRKSLPDPEVVAPRQRPEYQAPRTRAEEILAEIWEEVLGVERIGIYDSFLQLGGDSILGLQVVARAGQAGLRLTPRQVLEHQTVAELAQVAGFGESIQAEQGLVTGAVPLTPIQRWFLDAEPVDPHYYNQALLLEVGQRLHPNPLHGTVAHLLRHHDALRLRFRRAAGGWEQELAAPDDRVPFTAIDLAAVRPEARSALITEVSEALQGSLDLERGPLVRVVLLDLGPSEPQRLLFIVHHLAVDGVSWRILLEDLERFHEQLRSGEDVKLPAKTSSFQVWAERLAEFAHWEVVERQAAYWLAEPRRQVGRLIPDSPEAANRVESFRVLQCALDPEETRVLLEDVPRVLGAEADQVLLTALAQALARGTGSRRVLIDLESHGRQGLFEDVDLSRTVGWFTTLYPILLDLGSAFGPGEALGAVREQLRKLPHGGVGYGLLRYLGGDSEVAQRFRQMPPAEVVFNYLGQLDRPLPDASRLQVAREYTGSTRSPRALGEHLLVVDGSVGAGRLEVTWNFSPNLFRRASIDALVQDFVRHLRELLERCRVMGAGAFQPADFPQAEISPEDLERVLSRFQSGGAGE